MSRGSMTNPEPTGISRVDAAYMHHRSPVCTRAQLCFCVRVCVRAWERRVRRAVCFGFAGRLFGCVLNVSLGVLCVYMYTCTYVASSVSRGVARRHLPFVFLPLSHETRARRPILVDRAYEGVRVRGCLAGPTERHAGAPDVAAAAGARKAELSGVLSFQQLPTAVQALFDGSRCAPPLQDCSVLPGHVNL